MELPHRASSPKEVTLCGPGLDSSICSQNRPGNGYYCTHHYKPNPADRKLIN